MSAYIVATCNGEGTIFAELGDEVHFVNVDNSCTAGGPIDSGWQVIGGTGRFDGASGRMFVLSGLDFGVAGISAGTLTVRADLWADTMSLID